MVPCYVSQTFSPVYWIRFLCPAFFSLRISNSPPKPILYHKHAILLFLQLLSAEGSHNPAGMFTSLSLDSQSPLPPLTPIESLRAEAGEPDSTKKMKTKAVILKEHRLRIGMIIFKK